MNGMRAAFTAQLTSVEREIEAALRSARGTLTELAPTLPAPTEARIAALAGDGEALRREARRLDLRLLTLTATQAPVACDLYLVLSMVQLVQHLGLVANQFGLIAEQLTEIDTWSAGDREIDDGLREMVVQAARQLEHATTAFTTRDVNLARRLEAEDDGLDRRNRSICRAALTRSGPTPRRERALRSVLIARSLERIGDNAVGIARQATLVIEADPHGLAGPIAV
jgi:phosphate transport system protein